MKEAAMNSNHVVQHNSSKARLSAKRIGLDIEYPSPHLPIAEQEETDIM